MNTFALILVAAPSANSLGKVTRASSSCAPIDDADEYTGRRLLPLWDIAVRTKNLTLRRLVLRYEVEVEGVSIGGRLVA